MKQWLLVLVIIVVIVTVAFTLKENKKILIGGAEISVEVADTVEERSRGLSGRASLKENKGMLFVFDEPGIYPFWMKDMLFVIDIIWIGEEGRIVGINENVPPDSFPQTFSPPEPVRYVLEVPAGWVKNHDTKVGDLVELF